MTHLISRAHQALTAPSRRTDDVHTSRAIRASRRAAAERTEGQLIALHVSTMVS